jgi:hypothetical protein
MSSWLFHAPRNAGAALLTFLVFGLPLAWAFAAGMEAARRPEHRALPQPARFFFRREFRRRLRWPWLLAWGATLAGAGYWGRFHSAMATLEDPSALWLGLVSLETVFVAFGCWLMAACLVWAPRCRGDAAHLAAAALLMASGAWIGAEMVSRLLLDSQGLGRVVREIRVPSCCLRGLPDFRESYYDRVPFVQAGLGGAALLIAWGWARFQGERWFRRDD